MWTVRDIALALDGADVEHARRDQHRSPALTVARVDGRLDRGRIERLAVPLRAEVPDIVDTRAVQRVAPGVASATAGPPISAPPSAGPGTRSSHSRREKPRSPRLRPAATVVR